jgi:hypothetical protein
MVKHNPQKESKYNPYMDANNLYGWAMSQPLPIGGFKWMDGEELKKWTNLSLAVSLKWISNTPTTYMTNTTNIHSHPKG